MPLWKFRTLEEAEHHLDQRSTTPEASLDTALFLLSLSEATDVLPAVGTHSTLWLVGGVVGYFGV